MKNKRIRHCMLAILRSSSASWRLRTLPGSLTTLLLFCLLHGSFAAGPGQNPTATWDTKPVNSDWNAAQNWTPQIVPNDVSATAKFDFSTITKVATSESTVVHNVVFNANASPFTIFGPLTVHGGGITNNSGFVQNFVGSFEFVKSTAGNSTSFHTNGGVIFFDEATAGNAAFTNSGGTAAGVSGGSIRFFVSTAGNATITNNGGAVAGAPGGGLGFRASDAGNATIRNQGGAVYHAHGGEIKLLKASAANATFINEGGAVFGAQGARMVFSRRSFGGNATLIARGGKGPGSGAKIEFKSGAGGENARVEVFGNGNLDVSRPRPEADSVGSIEGNGLIFLGASQLSVGVNNLSTVFSGTISDEGGVTEAVGGSLIKVGTGTLTLADANTYTGGTAVDDGTLLVENTKGSATGTDAVQVNSGTLGGDGIIGGPVIVGSGIQSLALLAPVAKNGNPIAKLTVQGSLTFNGGSTYKLDVNSGAATADQIVAHGITINNNAFLSGNDVAQGNLPPGTVLTIIKNTASTPINGHFRFLPDGGTIFIKKNAFKADYQGGDGNDLTLTVQ